ncbi:PX-associated sorting nexin 13 [Penicillium taxi]|uniref:PX-associated sorting nexin 13 n=1 Tax=Penicillium taxi TaxID=168475 RepID=UPI0025458099|nr:PX-associated sorting nexin 13 [Penicillium taxi]KAJ5894146.1 PX-associated sorting nexin 13 [Penicillium taxi]
MTDVLRPGLQPASLKSGSTTASSRSTAIPAPMQPPLVRPSSRLKSQKTYVREEQVDPASEKATLALIRRVLRPPTSDHGSSSQQPPESPLPPLTSSNDVDLQLYAIIAIIMKDFVYSWYSKITPDQALVNEVLLVIAHCTRALEQRIRQIDVTQLVFDEIPALVEAHIASYRLAKKQSSMSGLPTSYRAIYHELNPHPGLSPVPDSIDPDTITMQRENEEVYRRLLANGILTILLPTEDLENSSLRTLVADVIADLILGKQVSGKICEGWFLYESITKLITLRHRTEADIKESSEDVPANQLKKFGLLPIKDESNSPQPVQLPATAWIWNVLQSVYLGYVALRFIATGLFRVASRSEQGCSHGDGISFPAATPPLKGGNGSSSDGVVIKRPVLDYQVFSMASRLLGTSQRMPWLSGSLALVQHLIVAGPGRLGDTNSILDRFLQETIDEYVLTPALLPNLLLASRIALFPTNAGNAAPMPGNVVLSASTPQLSAQPPTPTAKAVAPAPSTTPVQEGARAPEAVPLTRDATDYIHAGISKYAGNGSGSGDLTPSPPSTSTPESETVAPSESEIATIKRECAAGILAMIPRQVARSFFGLQSADSFCTGSSSSPVTIASSGKGRECGDQVRSTSPIRTAPSLPEQKNGIPAERSEQRPDEHDKVVDSDEEFLLQAIETDLLDLLSDEYCNKHLIYAIIETVLAGVLPELANRSVAGLMEDRGVTSSGLKA